ncbi:MAG: transmembrane anchor protein, partial [Gemmatimonadaceae bacterium]
MSADQESSQALPSTRTLLRSTFIAVAVACVLLVGAVLPAEYGVDPTGVGRVLGLTPMGRLKLALLREEAES